MYNVCKLHNPIERLHDHNTVQGLEEESIPNKNGEHKMIDWNADIWDFKISQKFKFVQED